MTKMTRIEVEVDILNIPEIQKAVNNYQEFIEAVRAMRKAEKHYDKTRNEDNLTHMRSAQYKVDKLLKKYPKKR